MLLSSDLIALPTVTLGAFLEGEAVIVGSTIASTLGPFHTWSVFAGAVLGTLLGDTLVYTIGRLVRGGADRVVFGRRIVTQEALDLAHRFYARHGGKTVFFLRFAYGMRTAGYFLAGASRMPYQRFAIADTSAVLVWCSILVSLGLIIGKSMLPYLSGWMGFALGGGAALFGAITVIILQRRVFPTLLPPPKQ